MSAARRGPLIDHECHQIRVGDEWRHLPPELWRVFVTLHAKRGRVVPIGGGLFSRGCRSLPLETIRRLRRRLVGSRFQIITHRSIRSELVLDPPE